MGRQAPKPDASRIFKKGKSGAFCHIYYGYAIGPLALIKICL